MSRDAREQLARPAPGSARSRRSGAREPVRQRVAPPQLDRVHLQRGGELVHLRLVREAGLHRAEAAHRAARRVVGVDDVGVDPRVRARRTGRTRSEAAFEHDRGRARRVRAAVEQDPRADRDEPAVARRAVLVAHARGVAVDVAEERLLAPVHHLHGAAGVEREQAGVDLHREVLAAAERAADAAEHEPHLLRRQVEARRRAGRGRRAATGWRCTGRRRRPRPARRGPDSGPRNAWSCMPTSYSPVTTTSPGGVRVAVADRHVAQQVAATGAAAARPGRARARGRSAARAPRSRPRSACAAARAVSGWSAATIAIGLALVADVLPREHRLVGDLQPVGLAAGHVLVGEHGVHAGHAQRGADLDRADLRARVRASAASRPTACRRPTVGRVGELALDLRDAVGAADALRRRPSRVSVTVLMRSPPRGAPAAATAP